MTDDGRLRVAARDDLRDPLPLAEGGDQCRSVGRGRDQVEVAHRLAATADAPASETAIAAGCAVSSSTTRCTAGSAWPRSPRLSAGFFGQRRRRAPRRIFSSLLRPRPESTRAAARPRRPSSARRASSHRARSRSAPPSSARRPGGAGTRRPRQAPAAPLRRGVHLAVVHDLDDLLLDRLPDPGQLGRTPRRAQARRPGSASRGCGSPRAGRR